MCFYAGDYDWYASVNEVAEGVAAEDFRCDECHKRFQAGSWRHHLHQQEHEYCQECEGDGRDECNDGQHWQGETTDYDRCEACDKILRAIKAYELEAGCPEEESQPNYGELREVLTSTQYDDRDKYAAKAVEMFPEVAPHLEEMIA